MQCPTTTRQPLAWARSRSSMRRRVLPTPASPARRTDPLADPLAEPGPDPRPTAALSRLSSWLRPTSWLTEAVGTGSIIVPGTDNYLRLFGDQGGAGGGYGGRLRRKVLRRKVRRRRGRLRRDLVREGCSSAAALSGMLAPGLAYPTAPALCGDALADRGLAVGQLGGDGGGDDRHDVLLLLVTRSADVLSLRV